MGIHNICFFYGKLEVIIPELSPNTPPLQVLCQMNVNYIILFIPIPFYINLNSSTLFTCVFIPDTPQF